MLKTYLIKTVFGNFMKSSLKERFQLIQILALEVENNVLQDLYTMTLGSSSSARKVGSSMK